MGHPIGFPDSMPVLSCNPHLQKQFAPLTGKVSAWFWGHEHELEVYDQTAIASSHVPDAAGEPLSQFFPWVPYGA